MASIPRYLGIALVTLSLTFVQFPSVAQSSQPNAREKLATYAKPAVVRVLNGCYGILSYEYQDENGKSAKHTYSSSYGISGSGFFITPDGYIATYAVKTEQECRQRLKQQVAKKHQLPADKLNFEQSSGKEIFDYVDDVFLPSPSDRLTSDDVNLSDSSDRLTFKLTFERKSSEGGTLEEGKDDVSIIKVKLDKENAPSLKLGDSDKVGLDDITLVGYSVNADNTKALKDTKVYEASVSDGKISNANRKLSNNSKAFELAIPGTYYAGSPVLNAQGEVVGIIAPSEKDRFYDVNGDDSENSSSSSTSALTLAIPAKAIEELLRSSNITNSQGEIDGWYRSGLELFWQGDYAGAKEKFEVVKDLFPQHSEVARLISESNKGRVDQFSKPNYAFWGAIAAAAAVILGLIFFLLQRKPKSAKRPSGDVRPFSKPAQTGISKANNVNSQVWLELERGGETLKLPLHKDIHRIGRDEAWSDVKMPPSWEVLSRQHAILKREGNSYRIFDGDGKVPSRNGLLVDDYDRVDTTVGHLLKPGETITIGKNPLEQVRITYFNSAVSQADNETKMAT